MTRKTALNASRKLIYRGVELPELPFPPRLPLADIQQAVAKAFADLDAAVVAIEAAARPPEHERE